MEMQNILLFVLVGAVCMVIVTGGVISMTTEDEPSTTNLASGAAVGGAIGAAASYLMTSDVSNMMGGFMDAAPDMKVGLPSF
jgi:hypothetical protein